MRLTQTSHVSTVPNRQRWSRIALRTAGTLSMSHFILRALKYGLIGSPHKGIKASLLLSGTLANTWSTVESALMSDHTENKMHKHENLICYKNSRAYIIMMYTECFRNTFTNFGSGFQAPKQGGKKTINIYPKILRFWSM